MTIEPQTYAIHVVRGDDWSLFFRHHDGAASPTYTDFTDWDGKAQIRADFGSSVLAEMTVTCDSEGVLCEMTRVQTTAIVDALSVAGPSNVGKWDIELTDLTGEKHTWLKGNVEWELDLTRDV